MGNEWLELAVLERRKYNYLVEVLELSGQMGDALDRNDQVALNMLLTMRQEPILALDELRRVIAERRRTLPGEIAAAVDALLAGATPHGEEQCAFLDQADGARRLLERVLELDRRLSQRLAGSASFYQN